VRLSKDNTKIKQMENKLPENFDWKFYLEYYEDLRNAGLKTKEDAEAHYLNHGQYENRLYFDYNNYEITIDEFFVYDEDIDVTLSGHIDLKEGLGKIMNAFKKLISKTNLKYNIIDTHKNHSVIKTITTTPKNEGDNKIGRININFNFPTEIPPKVNNLNYIYSMYESDKIHDEWTKNINKYYDGVIVPDEWVKEVYENSGVLKPIYVIPIPIDLDEIIVHKNKKNDVFTFGINSYYENRKNHKGVIESFVNLYGNDKKYKLKVRGRGGYTYENLSIKYKDYSNVIIEMCELNNKEMCEWYGDIDCYILASEGEGYSLTPRESIVNGIPTILSNCSSHKTLIKTGGVLGIETSGKKPSYKEGLFNDYVGNDYIIDNENIKNSMIEMVNNYEYYLRSITKTKEWIIKYETIDHLSVVFEDFLKKELSKKRYGVISTWNTMCGIADYTKYMTDYLVGFKIFSNEDEKIIDEEQETMVNRCFTRHIGVNKLIYELEKENITHLIINYHVLLFDDENLKKLCKFLNEKKIKTIIIPHNSTTIKDDTFIEMGKLNGILVHTEKEYNKIKNLVNNCYHFEHPIKKHELVNVDFEKSNHKLISSFGFLYEDKKIDILIDIFYELYLKNNSIKLLLLNAIHTHYPKEKIDKIIKKINKSIKDYGIDDNVIMINEYLPINYLTSFLSKSDFIIFLRDDTTESSSASVRTGLSCGVPVICEENSIYQDVTKYVHFIKSGEPKKMTNSILEIMSNNKLLDDKLKLQKIWINESSWENGVRKILKILN
jgi:glycosyltransferase involved in cell wall biosynthesis